MKRRRVWVLPIIALVMIVIAACSSAGNGNQSEEGQSNGGQSESNPSNSQPSSTTGSDSQSQSAASGETVVLKGVTAWSQTEINTSGFFIFKEKVEQMSGGKIQIDYAGGPEVIPPFDQGEAVRNGVVDIALVSAAYFMNQFPEGGALGFGEVTVEEEHQNGGWDYINELANQKMNMQLIAHDAGQQVNIFLKTPVDSIDDLKGKRIRVSPLYVPAMKALGIEPVTMPGGEIYSALERGVVDGFVWPEDGMTTLSLHEQVKYIVYPKFYHNDLVLAVNLDKWNSLPQDVKDTLTQAGREVEKEVTLAYQEFRNKEAKIIEEEGIQKINLDEDKVLSTVYDAAWEFMKENNPETIDQLVKYFRKN